MMSVGTSWALSDERPFPGLRPFRFEDHDYFFGRGDQIASLYRFFDHSRFITVVGSSGSGKSSLVRAGLLPLLEEENHEAIGRTWNIVQMHPGDAPIGSLATAMAQSLFPTDEAKIAAARRERMRFALRQSSFGIADALRDVDVAAGAAGSMLIVVDQFEELFRYAARRQGIARDQSARREEDATQFIQLLLGASRDRDYNIFVLLTMRSDFIGDCAGFRGLPETVSASQFLVPALTRDQREEAIVGPVRKAGATIEAALVEQLQNDAGDESDELPVLQHCLSRMWERAAGDQAAAGTGRSRYLTLEHYRLVGGLAQALSRHADALLAELSDKELAVEQTFRSLAEIDGEGRIVRRARLFSELCNETGLPPEDLRTVIERFRDEDCSFLTPSKLEVAELGDETRIDVGHEALLRRWDRVSGDPRSGAPANGWIRAEEADGRIYRGLLAMAESHGKIGADAFDERWRWWTERPRTGAWAQRYGGNKNDVDQLFSDSRAEIDAATTARKAAEETAERQRLELERQAERAREAEREKLELAAQSARAREQSALRYAQLARRAAIGVSALLCLTVAFGILFYEQRLNALQQKANAEKSLAIGGDLTKSLLAKVQAYLDTGSVSVDVAKDLLNAAQQNLVKLKEVTPTPAIRAMRANLLLGFSDVYSALQDDRTALNYSQQALALANSLADDADDANQKLLYSAQFRIGDAQSNQSDFSDGLQAYKAALAVVGALNKKEPENYVWAQDTAFITVKLGDIYRSDGPAGQALRQYEEALSINQTLIRDHPDVPGLQRDLATALTRIGDLRKEQNDTSAALKNYQSALFIRRQLAARAQDDASLQSNLSVAYNRVAEMSVQQKAYDDAASLYNEALAIRKKLADSDPTNSTWESYLAYEYVYIGDMRLAKQDFSGAADSYRQSLKIRSDLVVRDARNFGRLKNLADSHSKLAVGLHDEGDLAGALAERNTALELRLTVVANYPDNVTRHKELADEYVAIGDILKQQADAAGTTADYAAALGQYQKALGVIETFDATHPGRNSLDQKQTSIMTQKIAPLQPKSP